MSLPPSSSAVMPSYAKFSELAEVTGKIIAAVDLGRAWRDFYGCEARDRLAQCHEGCVECKIE
jgi:hypothetical protein